MCTPSVDVLQAILFLISCILDREERRSLQLELQAHNSISLQQQAQTTCQTELTPRFPKVCSCIVIVLCHRGCLCRSAFLLSTK